MARWMVVTAVLVFAGACSSSNKKACENIFKITTGSASVEKGGVFLEMCLQNQTADRIGTFCKNAAAMLDCAATAADKDTLLKCKDKCERKDCKAIVKAVVARAGDQLDDKTKEAMLARAETDLACTAQWSTFNFP